MSDARARRSGGGPLGNVVDLYDYVQPRRPSTRAPRARPSDAWQPVVLDDWPNRIPVTDPELDVIEAHFGPLLDKLFGRIN